MFLFVKKTVTEIEPSPLDDPITRWEMAKGEEGSSTFYESLLISSSPQKWEVKFGSGSLYGDVFVGLGCASTRVPRPTAVRVTIASFRKFGTLENYILNKSYEKIRTL